MVTKLYNYVKQQSESVNRLHGATVEALNQAPNEALERSTEWITKLKHWRKKQIGRCIEIEYKARIVNEICQVIGIERRNEVLTSK